MPRVHATSAPEGYLSCHLGGKCPWQCPRRRVEGTAARGRYWRYDCSLGGLSLEAVQTHFHSFIEQIYLNDLNDIIMYILILKDYNFKKYIIVEGYILQLQNYGTFDVLKYDIIHNIILMLFLFVYLDVNVCKKVYIYNI